MNRDALARYLAGTSTPDEEARVQAWLDAHPEIRLDLEGQSALPADYADRRDPDAALARIMRRTAPATPREKPPVRPAADRRSARRSADRQRQRYAPLARMAAIVVVLALVGLLVHQFMPPTSEPALRVIATRSGERTQVTLADGSIVELNVASHLLLPEVFDLARREVWLEGEAFFDVAPDPKRPFIIHAGPAAVEVLGTAFNVEGYPDEEDVSVLVVEGRVALRADATPDAEGATLEPGQMGRLTAGSALTVEPVAMQDPLAWRDGRLVFEGTPLATVARELSRWYGVEVDLADDALATLRLDASFSNEPLPDVLATIALTLDIGYRQDDGRVTFVRNA